MRASQYLKNGLLMALLATGVAGCGGDMDELDAYINRIKALPGGRIDPLPEIIQYVDFTYIADAQGLRSPFTPDTPQIGNSTGGTRPDLERSREYLETFPLDTLSMVGTLQIGGTNFGLVLAAADGLIHRVTPGNYLGQNDGRVTEISESGIAVVEIISDGIGGYIERDASISLKD